MSYAAAAPAYWDPSLSDGTLSQLDEELCVVNAEHFFMRARLVIPVVDGPPGAEFEWGVWVSLSPASFSRAVTLWAVPGREQEPPYFGWLSTELPLYEPSTLQLGTNIHTQPVGSRPIVTLEPTDHPLAVDQRSGITLARVQEIAEILLHSAD